MGFFSGISKKIGEMWQRAKDKQEFFADLMRAAEDGKLTGKEITQIETRFKELMLTDDDLRKVRALAYAAALYAAKSDGSVTAKEEKEIAKIQQFLNIPDAEIAKSKKELARLRLLCEIQDGNPPSITVKNIILKKNEKAYWTEPASILEERVVKRGYQGGSHGVSIRIVKGVSYRIGGHRGQLVIDKAVIPVSNGELVITNNRVIFGGSTKSFSIGFDKLLEFYMYSDGVRLTDDKGNPRIIQLADKANIDVVGATLSFAINQFANS